MRVVERARRLRRPWPSSRWAARHPGGSSASASSSRQRGWQGSRSRHCFSPPTRRSPDGRRRRWQDAVAVERRGMLRGTSVVVAAVSHDAGSSGGSCRPRSVATRAGDADEIVRTARVDVSTAGAQAHRSSSQAVLSATGRYVAFVSRAANLVPGDLNRVLDVFVRDLSASRTERVSISTSGVESDGPSGKPSISADGRIVAFPSVATNLVPPTATASRTSSSATVQGSDGAPEHRASRRTQRREPRLARERRRERGRVFVRGHEPRPR